MTNAIRCLDWETRDIICSDDHQNDNLDLFHLSLIIGSCRSGVLLLRGMEEVKRPFIYIWDKLDGLMELGGVLGFNGVA